MNERFAKFAGLTPYWVLLYVACWPWPALAEAALSLGSIIGLSLLLVSRFRSGTQILRHEAWALTTVLFFCYWLAEAISVIDSYDVKHSAIEVLKDLRYLPFLWLVAISCAQSHGRKVIAVGISVILSVWLIDASLQAFTGFSIRGASAADRLSGIFGAGNLKIGLVLASMSPFLLLSAGRRFGFWAWIGVATMLGFIILLAGARAAWLTLALAFLVSSIYFWKLRRALLLVGTGGLFMLVLAASFPDYFQQRIERTLTALQHDGSSIDYALSGRVEIWRHALEMYADHPINGVGVDQFQSKYLEYAPATDQFVEYGRPGAFHAHQIVLEVLSETGAIGLLLWLMATALAIRAWRFASVQARERALPSAMALAITVFPLNTHLAFYSTFWGGLTLLLSALYVGHLAAADSPEPAAVTNRDAAAS